jgi:hypothetical protein
LTSTRASSSSPVAGGHAQDGGEGVRERRAAALVLDAAHQGGQGEGAGVTGGGVGEVLVGHAEAAAEQRRGDRVGAAERRVVPGGRAVKPRRVLVHPHRDRSDHPRRCLPRERHGALCQPARWRPRRYVHHDLQVRGETERRRRRGTRPLPAPNRLGQRDGRFRRRHRPSRFQGHHRRPDHLRVPGPHQSSLTRR